MHRRRARNRGARDESHRGSSIAVGDERLSWKRERRIEGDGYERENHHCTRRGRNSRPIDSYRACAGTGTRPRIGARAGGSAGSRTRRSGSRRPPRPASWTRRRTHGRTPGGAPGPRPRCRHRPRPSGAKPCVRATADAASPRTDARSRSRSRSGSGPSHAAAGRSGPYTRIRAPPHGPVSGATAT